MTVTFNHTIVYATDKHHSAEFLANVLGLPKPQAMWSFMTVPLDHGVALDFATADGPISPQQINHNDGGRGVYFADPDGHYLEAITRPYGSDGA